jgi:hypothetical protein
MSRTPRRPQAAVKDNRAAKVAMVVILNAGLVAALAQLILSR